MSEEPLTHLLSHHRPVYFRRMETFHTDRHTGETSCLERFEAYEVKLGSVSYIGSFSAVELIDWIRGVLPDPPKRQPVITKPTKPTLLDIDIQI